MKTVLIHLEGGIVQAILCDKLPEEEIRFVVMDFDTEGASPEEISTVHYPDGWTEEAVVSEQPLYPCGISIPDINLVFTEE